MADEQQPRKRRMSRRMFAGGAVVGGAGLVVLFRRQLRNKLAHLTERADFSATPALRPHDPKTEQRTLQVGRGQGPAGNVDAVIAKLGGIDKVVGTDDVVIIKVSAQWWNQGMTNVAAVRRVIEQILARPGFAGEVIVFENTHFLDRAGGALTRAWTRPSERNVDVPGWNKLGDLIPHFQAQGAPVSFVGLVDAGKSELADDPWHDPAHDHGVYGGDGRGPIADGELRDGYRWDFDDAFRRKRSLVDYAQSPLTWPVFTSPHSGLIVDLKDGLFKRAGNARVAVPQKLTWITMSTVNEHASTGFTCACKSAMGIVDMSAGQFGSDPRAKDYQSVHYFGFPNANWRMAGPLAHFARKIRTPDLFLAVAEWVAATPTGVWNPDDDIRMAEASAHHVDAIVAGTDPVAVDTWCAKNLLMPLGGANAHQLYDVENPDARLTRFLRYYREVYESGTLDLDLIHVA